LAGDLDYLRLEKYSCWIPAVSHLTVVTLLHRLEKQDILLLYKPGAVVPVHLKASPKIQWLFIGKKKGM